MFDKAKIQAEYKKVCEGAGGMGDQSRRAALFAAAVRRDIGLTDSQGRVSTDTNGLPRLRTDAPIPLASFSLRQFTEAVLGPDWADTLGLNDNGFSGNGFRRLLSEADAGAIGPSAFMNVAAWSSAISGLYAAQFIDSYSNQPEYKIRALFPDRKAEIWQGGQRLIDIFPPYEPLPAVGPGQEAPSMKLDALWVETSPLVKYAGKIEVLKETAHVDISGGQFMSKAKMAGASAALRENENAISIVTGQVNNFRLGFLNDAAATSYNTYGPTINGVAIPNDLTNPVNDVGAFTISKQALSNIKNPMTGYPMAVELPTTIVPMRLEDVFMAIASAQSTAALTQIVSTAFQQPPADGKFPTFQTNMENPYRRMFSNIVSDQWFDHRHTLSTTQGDPNRVAGLGLSDANAYRWYRLDPQKFAARLVGWDLSVLDLNPTDYVMATRGIIAGQVVTVASTYQVLNPYFIQRNKVA
jgi:hypothetical protein